MLAKRLGGKEPDLSNALWFLLNTAQAILPGAADYPALMQIDPITFKFGPRTTFGTGSDMGAVERMSN